MQKATYWMWWREMFKRWWFYWGIVGVIQLLFWFVPEKEAGNYLLFVRLLSVAILVIPLLIWIPFKIWRDAKPEIVKDQEKHPNSYISVHICRVDSSQMQSRQGEFIDLNICFCNALFYDVRLTRLNGSAVINKNASNELPKLRTENNVELKRGFTSRSLRLNATSSFADELRNAVLGTMGLKPFRIELKLTGNDDKGMPYEWSAIYGG